MGDDLSPKEIAEMAMAQAMKMVRSKRLEGRGFEGASHAPGGGRAVRNQFDLKAAEKPLPAHVVKQLKA